MPTKSRRETIEEMLAADPNDTFLRYGLAMEMAREGQTAEAVGSLRKLIADSPDYVAAYFQAAQLLVRQGETNEAAELLRQGIAAAQAKPDMHAVEEMSAFLDQIV